ncbi:YggT family protein [Succinimonas amylolytica]|uniref:YggT family protein n=1 Tax=Succinimonas amylolytica TaxID=83769 RepID=UPI00035D23E8|nr:YggT family protein [Succinimonas amylolytica]
MSYSFILSFIPALVFFTRFLMEYTSCDYYHPACRWIVRITNPLVRIIPVKKIMNLNISALILMLVMAEIFGGGFVYWSMTGFRVISFDLIWRLMLLVPVLLIWAGLQYMLYIMIIGAIMSWFPVPALTPWKYLFNKLTSPITEPFERFIPPIGFFSIAFIVAFLLMSFVVFTVMPKITSYAMQLIFKL